jgi:hypothetical protein
MPIEAERITVLYCQSGNRSAMAAERLMAEGATGVMFLAGGFGAWKSAKLKSVGHSPAGVSIMRQAQVAIGCGVMSFVLLGVLLSPWWLVMPTAMGAGLLFAGLTGTCGLASLLKYMPWNRTRRHRHQQRDAMAPSCCS